MAKKDHSGGGRWIQELQTDDTVEEDVGTFSAENSPEDIAIELKRKAPDFQAAMGKITLYMNRAGKRLSKSRIKELERVRTILREMYNRKDRTQANKKASLEIKCAGQWATWVDQNNLQHIGDQYLELLLAEPSLATKVHPEVKPQVLQEYKDWLLERFRAEIPFPTPKNIDEEIKDFTIIKHKMTQQFQKGTDVPIFEVDHHGKPISPIVIPKVACVQNIYPDGRREMCFASEENALQFLSNFLEEKIIVAKQNTKTFKCPECGTKVLENTGYCVKCKKKVKKASECLRFSSADNAIQYLADITGKKIKVGK